MLYFIFEQKEYDNWNENVHNSDFLCIKRSRVYMPLQKKELQNFLSDREHGYRGVYLVFWLHF